MNLKFFRMREGARLPHRAHPSDAGMDVFYCPKSDKPDKLYEVEDFWIPPKASRLLPTGLKVEIPEGYMLEIKNKSGIASKRQLVVGACVVDPGYDGEMYVNLHNLGSESQVIKAGDKIAQAVLVPIIHCGVEEVFEDKLNLYSSRGGGGFGSTGDR